MTNIEKTGLEMKIDSTSFSFSVENYVPEKQYKKNTYHEFYWCNINLNIVNQNFRYEKMHDTMLTSQEIDILTEKLEKLLNNQLKQPEELTFWEPDIEFTLIPKHELQINKHILCANTIPEVIDTYLELRIYPTDYKGVYTSQYYSITFDRNEIDMLFSYLKGITSS